MSDTIDQVNPYARKVSLKPELQRPEAIEPLRRAVFNELPRAAGTYVKTALNSNYEVDMWYQRVRPVTTRSRLSASRVEVVYVRTMPRYGSGLVATWVRRYDRDETHPGKDKWKRLPTIRVRRRDGMVYWTSAGTANEVTSELREGK